MSLPAELVGPFGSADLPLAAAVHELAIRADAVVAEPQPGRAQR